MSCGVHTTFHDPVRKGPRRAARVGDALGRRPAPRSRRQSTPCPGVAGPPSSQPRARPGVCVGEVGAIFGLEVSRFARSSADLQRLLELCSLSDTLIIDSDGTYDLAQFNDRLLLGLKGTMSEAELHLLAGRLHGAKQAAAGRGALRFPLPVGMSTTRPGRRCWIRTRRFSRPSPISLFGTFTARGSAYGVVGAFAARRFPRRAYGGAWAGDSLGPADARARPRHPRQSGLLLGRTCWSLPRAAHAHARWHDSDQADPSAPAGVGVLIRDHHPGYISWEMYLANQSGWPHTVPTRGSPEREGQALSQGSCAVDRVGGR